MDRPVGCGDRGAGVEEPFEVIGIERRTATIVELWLRPLDRVLEYLPGE